METKEMQDLFRATAECMSNPQSDLAYKAFAQALQTPILQEIRLRSVARELFAVENLAPGAQAG